jgi:hypothetical protein
MNAMVILEGLQGRPVAEICTEPPISQAQEDQGRDPFLAHATKVLVVHEQRQRQLARETAR